MNLNIGEKISAFRKEQSKTQEQLADYVGVSVAAVSKWETKQSYPDITLLPSIADFFEVSIDALLDYRIMDNEKNVENIRMAISEAERNSDYKTALPLIFGALRKYPNNIELLKSAGSMLQTRAWDSETREQDFKDSINYYEKALKCSVDEREKLWLKRSVSFVYDAMGDTKRALETILEINASNAFDLDIAMYKYRLGEKKDAKKLVQGHLWNMAFMFYMTAGRLADCYADEGNLEMSLESQKFHAQFLSAFINDTPNYADQICVWSYFDIAKYCKKLAKDEEMWENLEKAVFHAVRFDKNPSYKIESIKFMDGIGENCMIGNNNSEMACHALLKNIQHEFNDLSYDERYIRFCEELDSAKKTKLEAGIWN